MEAEHQRARPYDFPDRTCTLDAHFRLPVTAALDRICKEIG